MLLWIASYENPDIADRHCLCKSCDYTVELHNDAIKGTGQLSIYIFSGMTYHLVVLKVRYVVEKLYISNISIITLTRTLTVEKFEKIYLVKP